MSPIREIQHGLMKLFNMYRGMVLQKSPRDRARIQIHFSSYVALMCDLVDKEPTCFEVAIQNTYWVEAMA